MNHRSNDPEILETSGQNAAQHERKSFNDVLKKKEELQKQQQAEKTEDGHVALDDAKRVKVLSPGQLVFKRFIRNKLAIFGVCVLLAMFVFAFVAPLFYPYGYKETFYRYGHEFNTFSVSTYRSDYSSFILNPDVPVNNRAQLSITSAIKTMEENGLKEYLIEAENETYVLEKTSEKVYILSANDGDQVATVAAGAEVATYDRQSKSLDYLVEPLSDGFAAAVEKALAAMPKTETETTFSFEGMDFRAKLYEGKFKYMISIDGASIVYTGEVLGEAFVQELSKAIEKESGDIFTVDGKQYAQITTRGVVNVYAVNKGEEALVNTTLNFSGTEAAAPEFLTQLFYNLDKGSFEYEGQTYKVTDDEGDSFIVFDAAGEEVGVLSNFVTNNKDGKDVVSLRNKEAIRECVDYMIENGLTGQEKPEEYDPEKDDSIVWGLMTKEEQEQWMQKKEEERLENTGVSVTLYFDKQVADFTKNSKGKPEPTLEYVYDENGEKVQEEVVGKVVRKDNYYYVSCNQWRYLMDISSKPSEFHLLGTDTDGYDVLSRMMYGGRISLLVGFVVVIIETLLGVIMGGIAGYFGGWVDNLIMRLVDIFYCIPSMPILIIMGSYMDKAGLDPIPRLMWMMAILGFLGWAGVARLVRGQILSLREQEFMVATEATGVKVRRRIFRHLIPNVMPQLIVSATAGLGAVILTESTLSFLGLGVKRPMATWGAIISGITSSNENILNFTYIWIPVGVLICLTVIAFNFVGDGLRDAFDPKMKR